MLRNPAVNQIFHSKEDALVHLSHIMDIDMPDDLG
jgi:hypothetical protein